MYGKTAAVFHSRQHILKEGASCMASQPAPRAVIEYFTAITRMDPDAWIDCFTEQAMSYEPGAGSPLQGHARLRQFLVGVLGAFRQLQLTADHIFTSGNRVAVKFTGHGTGKNGRNVTFEGIDVFEINENGKIQMMWGYWDPDAMMAQLQGS
jgi:steroid delta-isomerase